MDEGHEARDRTRSLLRGPAPVLQGFESPELELEGVHVDELLRELLAHTDAVRT